jgi:hypothetical protein
MAWQIAVVVDPSYEVSALDALTGQMPVWAVSTPVREQAAAQIRRDSESLWEPEPSFTLFQSSSPSDPDTTSLDILDPVQSKHPQVSALQLIGVTGTNSLRDALGRLGYLPASGKFYPGLRMRKPLAKVPGVRNLFLNAANWKTSDDVYESFFLAVGAPPWNGKNFNALRDSIVTGNVNKIAVPYRLIVQHYEELNEDVRPFADQFLNLIREFEAEGCPVTVQYEETQP